MFNFLSMRAGNIVFTIIGILLGYILAVTLNKKTEHVVKYVSQEEILGFERERIESIDDPEQRQLFFGKPKRAAELMEENALVRGDKNSEIIFSAGKVYGQNVRSISRDIYDEVIEKLHLEDGTTGPNTIVEESENND